MQQIAESAASPPINVVTLRFVQGNVATLADRPVFARPETDRPTPPVRPALGEKALRGLAESRAEAEEVEIIPARKGPGRARRGKDEPAATRPEPAGRSQPGPAREQAERSQAEKDARIVEELAKRDKEVRRHEQAHAVIGGQYAGQPKFTYRTGPDGRRYAVSGEVPIDVAPVRGDPEATIRKMEVVKAAALAPAEPSGADRRIAALADAQRLRAIAELARMKAEERARAREAAQTAAEEDARETAGTTPPRDPHADIARQADIIAFIPGTGQGRQLDRAA
ncbi:MAG: hypothetical protein D6754_15035 [Alphaproteobacteria bacterium]|nr:MAG: hypothetical protein D6754_15035 [Alphaproteobacteria bacterium]